ncbi:MAG: polyprenyl synthetase family protein [Muribaculaceae bacterium]|nr:polyprenyl synthetase family protein [Muribaculaceae bacterium]
MNLKTIQQLKKLADRSIDDVKFTTGPKGLYDPVKYALDGSGKRLRPLLLLVMAEAFGADAEKYLHQAAALEMFHNFTLVHDDIMDKASLRHGVATVYRKWNVPTAILCGDAMLTYSNILMMDGLPQSVIHRVMMIFSETSMKIYEGQQLDMDFETSGKVTIDEYIEMIMLKTGALFGCSTAIGLLLSKDEKTPSMNILFKNVVKLGYLIGVIFQLQDDMLDTFGNSQTFGKVIGGDILNDKKTWLLINALNSNLKNEVKRVIANKELTGDEKIKEMKTLYDRLQLKEKITTEINKNVKLASETLDSIGENLVPGGKELIWEYINLIIGREK